MTPILELPKMDHPLKPPCKAFVGLPVVGLTVMGAVFAMTFVLVIAMGAPRLLADESKTTKIITPGTKTTALEGLYALEIDLPETYVVKGIEGVNFMVNYIALRKKRTDGKFNAIGVYIGFTPNHFCKGDKDVEGRAVTIGPWKTKWRECPSSQTPGAFHRETHIAPGKGDIRLHLFISGNEKEEMDRLEKMVETLRPVEP